MGLEAQVLYSVSCWHPRGRGWLGGGKSVASHMGFHSDCDGGDLVTTKQSWKSWLSTRHPLTPPWRILWCLVKLHKDGGVVSPHPLSQPLLVWVEIGPQFFLWCLAGVELLLSKSFLRPSTRENRLFLCHTQWLSRLLASSVLICDTWGKKKTQVITMTSLKLQYPKAVFSSFLHLAESYVWFIYNAQGFKLYLDK